MAVFHVNYNSDLILKNSFVLTVQSVPTFKGEVFLH